MKKIITIFITLLIISSSYAQSELRKVEDFTIINISNALEVVLTKGDKNEVKVIANDQNTFEKVKTDVIDGKLTIYTKGKITSKESIKIHITYKQLLGIEQSGATELSNTNPIKADKFYLKGSGAIEVKLNFDVQELTLDFSGASEIKLQGKTNDLVLSLSGASELSALDFKIKNANIDISGASEVKVFVTESIEGGVSGASEVKVKGGVPVDKIKSSGISSISKV
jgi:hypothetical protein